VEPAKKHATYQDVLVAPDDKVAEVIFGQLVLSPRPARRHGRAASRIDKSLAFFACARTCSTLRAGHCAATISGSVSFCLTS
jgi:hypothetical protein